jgi:hypothetical protein
LRALKQSQKLLSAATEKTAELSTRLRSAESDTAAAIVQSQGTEIAILRL